MAKDDVAILTGISRYPNPGYQTLDGPPNDLDIVERWLLDPGKGALEAGNIKKVFTPKPYPLDTDPATFDLDLAPPVPNDFDLIFKKLVKARMGLKEKRVSGRLYLYFSGHGFCNRSQDRPSEAALYCANATRESYEHIFGTQYARVAASWALFKEVVLIMDCCRDSEITRVPTPRPYRDTPDDELAADVHVLSIYAVPKGGKAQERAIPERDNKVHGLLTHALMKLLDEATPAQGNQLSATELRLQMLQSWTSICGSDAAPRPEIYLPPNGEIYFATRASGSAFEFKWGTHLPDGTVLCLTDATFQDFAVFPLTGAGTPIIAAQSPILGHERGDRSIRLRMRQGLYEYRLIGGPQKSGNFKVDGGDGHVDL